VTEPEAEIQVRALGRDDVPAAADALAAAFHDDPLFAWLLPSAASRRRRLRRFFGTELRFWPRRDASAEVACASGRIVGAALWYPPGCWKPGQVELSALPGYLRAYGRRFSRLAHLATSAARAHPHAEPHWYLTSIGVAPEHQGRGAGAALLRSGLRHCDQEQPPAYLESSKPENVPFYQRFGFHRTGTLDLPDGAPVNTTMWRPAP
jgi:ribosomal protein S18 acetylase RimI-like enzyme